MLKSHIFYFSGLQRHKNGGAVERLFEALHNRSIVQTLRDRSRVVPRSDSACVFTERFLRSGNAGFTKSRRVIGEHVSHPLVGWRSSDQDGWGLRSNLICRGIFEDFHAGSKGNLYSKIATPRLPYVCCEPSRMRTVILKSTRF